MKFIGFDGREHSVESKKYLRSTRANASKLHKKAFEYVQKYFPNTMILEEIPLKGSQTSQNSMLHADYYLPQIQLVIEIHGKQHYEYSPHFHGTREAFQAHLKRDETKKEWCEINGITYLVLPHNKDWDSILHEFNKRRNPIC